METIFERVGALDVHKAQVTACVRVPDAAGQRVSRIWPSSRRPSQGLLALADWLKAFGVTHVAMEATGVYWQPVWHILEDDFELTLCNARHVKNVPGRKTDVSDAQWLCQLMEAGPAARQLRAAQAAAPAARADALSQDADRRAPARGQPAAQGAGGHRHQARLRRHRTSSAPPAARCSTRSSPARPTREVLADLAKGKLRKKIPALREALEGRFEAHHALIIGAILAHLDFLDEQIDRLSEAIEDAAGPYRAGRRQAGRHDHRRRAAHRRGHGR